MNAGMYQLMLTEKNITGIDIVTPNNLGKFALVVLLPVKEAVADLRFNWNSSLRAGRHRSFKEDLVRAMKFAFGWWTRVELVRLV